jgi:predicted nucleotide-binding protein (sugar kinase/HSP70/actin superfamily)
MERLAIPNIGNYGVAFAALADALGVEADVCRNITPKMMELGSRHAPECCCVPFKAYLGHFLHAAGQGARHALMVNSLGKCRLTYYRILQQKLLDDAGVKMTVWPWGYDGYKPQIVRHFAPSLRQFFVGGRCYFIKLMAVDRLEAHVWQTRPLEINPGDTTALMDQALTELEGYKTIGLVRAFIRRLPERFAAIPQDCSRRPLRVGLLGECAVLRDRFLNHNVEEVLGGLGCQVRNFFQIGSEMRTIFHLGFMHEHSPKNQLKKARGYLHCDAGGHALDTVANAIRCAEESYHGVVHLAPTGCMPEVSVRPILRNACRDKGLSLLELSFDEHSAHTGVCTRLEAFVDMLSELRAQREAS